MSVEDHVEHGSKGPGSQFISCCKSMSAIKRFSANTFTYPKRAVEMNININTCNIIDLTDEGTLDLHISPWNEKARNFARHFEEVLVVGVIPGNCIVRTFILE